MNGKIYVEVKNKRNTFHPDEDRTSNEKKTTKKPKNCISSTN